MKTRDTSDGTTPHAAFASHPYAGMGRQAVPGEIELRTRSALMASEQRWLVLAALLLPVAGLVAVVIYMLPILGGESQTAGEMWRELLEKLGQVLAADPVQLLLFLSTLVLGLFSFAHGMRERVFIGPEGIRYVTGLPGLLAPLRPGWSVRRDQIRGMRIAPSIFGPAPSAAHLEIDTGASTHKLLVFAYADPDDFDAGEYRGLTALRSERRDIEALFEKLPLVRYGRELGFALELPGASGTASTSMEETPRLTAALIFVFAAFAYAVVDMGLAGETYAAGAPLSWILAAGLGMGVVAWPLLGDEELSRPVRAGVAALVAGATMLALYPGLVRVNAIGAEAAQPHNYRHAEANRLEPIGAGSPALDLPELPELLGSRPGDEHELWLRRGRLGFWQIDIDRLLISS